MAGKFGAQILPDISVPWPSWDSPEIQMFFNLLIRTVKKIFTDTVTLTPTSVGANSTDTQSFTVSGLSVNDIVFVNPPNLASGLGIAYVYVSATNTLRIRFFNITAGPLTPASGSYHIAAIRQ